jgi:hypothetical protein
LHGELTLKLLREAQKVDSSKKPENAGFFDVCLNAILPYSSKTYFCTMSIMAATTAVPNH